MIILYLIVHVFMTDHVLMKLESGILFRTSKRKMKIVMFFSFEFCLESNIDIVIVRKKGSNSLKFAPIIKLNDDTKIMLKKSKDK